jgi:DNA replication and repair protein RecF
VKEAGSPVRLTGIRIRDFRNIDRADLDIPREGFALVGGNGHGKTNLLEALYYLHLLRSVRGARDSDLVRFGANGFFVGAPGVVGGPHDGVTAAYEKRGRRKRVTLDDVPVTRLSEALGALPCVFMSPADAALASGPPSGRRRYLDIALALTSPRYLASLLLYRSALVRRNATLRSQSRSNVDALAAAWEPALAEHGAILWIERLRWIEWASPMFAELCRSIGEHSDARLEYSTSRTTVADEDAAREALAAALLSQRPSDVRRGLTQSGPHRDDIDLSIRPREGGAYRELRLFGSAGQQRTAAFALRFLEAAIYRERLGMVPILLMDDPFAELDALRSRRILELLGDGGPWQTILAVPRGEEIPDELTGLARWQIVHGSIDAAVTVQ